jgi:hypothetical protein
MYLICSKLATLIMRLAMVLLFLYRLSYEVNAETNLPPLLKKLVLWTFVPVYMARLNFWFSEASFYLLLGLLP